MSNLVGTLQKLIKTTMDADNPTDIVMGEVLTINPLTIKLEQQDILPQEFFLLTKAVTDHYVDIEVNHVTENRAGGGGLAEYASHNHDYKGKKKIMIYNGLQIGEKVILLRRRGAQGYVVLDRVFAHQTSGEWL